MSDTSNFELLEQAAEHFEEACKTWDDSRSLEFLKKAVGLMLEVQRRKDT